MQQTRVLNQFVIFYTCSLITYALHIELLIDTAPEKINWCQICRGNTQGARFSQLALCIQCFLRQTIK